MTEVAEHDAVIIGAGVAGALIAAELAKNGVRTLVLEAGPRVKDRTGFVESYATALAKVPSAPYGYPGQNENAPAPRVTDGPDGYYQQEGPARFKSTYQRLVGGSTWHWLGNAPRFLVNDFRMKTLYGIGDDWPDAVRYQSLEEWYNRAEEEIGVSGDHDEWNGLFDTPRSKPFPMPRIWPAFGDSVVAAKLNGQVFDEHTVEVRVTPQARNSTSYQGRPSCAGNSSCVPLCPIQAKYDATVHVKMAEEPKGAHAVAAEVRDRCVATRLEVDNGKVTRVHYYRWNGEGQRVQESAGGMVFVVAAHAIESPLLLLRSGIATSSPVGQYLMDHPQGYGGAILPKPVYPFRGPPVTSGIDAFRDGSFRSERAAFRISIGNDAWGRLEPLDKTIRTKIYQDQLIGTALRDAIHDRVTRMLRMSFSTEMLPAASNRVEIADADGDGNIRPKIHFQLPDYNRKSFEYAVKLLGKFFNALGAEETTFTQLNGSFSGAGHIMGTCRMGIDPKSSVVNTDCQVHDHPELYVVGAQSFPTGGTANPTLTVAALALRASENIISQVQAG